MGTGVVQGKLWSVAPLYWSQHFEPWFLPIYRKVLEQLQLTEEELLLDAGCGSGLFAYVAGKSGVKVTGVDAAPGLLHIARRRNLSDDFLEGDLEALPFADNSFHVVTAFNSFQYAENFEKALQEAKRVVKPGGRIALGIWDKPECSDSTQILEAIGSLLPPPAPGTAGAFALSEDGKIEAICARNELTILSCGTVTCPFLYTGLLDGIRSWMGTGPAAAAMNCNSRDTVEDAIARALHPFRVAGNFYFLQNQFLVFIMEK